MSGGGRTVTCNNSNTMNGASIVTAVGGATLGFDP